MTTTTMMTTGPTTTSPPLAGLRVAVDVQHLYRPPPRHHDRGASYLLVASGAHVNEADLVLLYASALGEALHLSGAEVLINEPGTGRLIGTYGERNRAAAAWGAHAYLACHMNSGGGRYCMTEHLSLNPGADLGAAIVARLRRAFPVLTAGKVVALKPGERGTVCIAACPARMAAVIVEPCFGDQPSHQSLLVAPRLAQMGEAIAQGVADWWAMVRMRITPA